MLITDNSDVSLEMDDISEIINVLKKYFIAYSLVLVDFLFVATFVIKIKKIDKSRTSISN